jgi:hypothetical protein
MVDSFSDLKVLVIGDIIFDEYETVQVQGLTSKNRILSGRRLYGIDKQVEAFAVYRHALEFIQRYQILERDRKGALDRKRNPKVSSARTRTRSSGAGNSRA